MEENAGTQQNVNGDGNISDITGTSLQGLFHRHHMGDTLTWPPLEDVACRVTGHLMSRLKPHSPNLSKSIAEAMTGVERGPEHCVGTRPTHENGRIECGCRRRTRGRPPRPKRKSI